MAADRTAPPNAKEHPGSRGLSAAIDISVPFPVSAEVQCGAGQLMALIGPSGSGKTTVLRALAGLIRPSHGRISVAGELWFDAGQRIFMRPQDRRVGLVFQDFALFPHLTARETVAIAIDPANTQSRTARLDEADGWLKRVNLEGFGDRKPHALSGGQRQRVAVARALARRPKLLLLDEPFSAVDQMTRERLKRELAQLRATLDIPILLVTHDLDEARALADRLTILHRGQVLQVGDTEQVCAEPASIMAARLLGHTNIFDCRVAAVASSDQPGRIAWGAQTLEVRRTGDFRDGDVAKWIAPDDAIVMHRRDRPSHGERENPVSGVVSELTPLGSDTLVAVAISDEMPRLNFRIATHAARRNSLEIGAEITVSLLAEGIHLIPSVDPVPEPSDAP
ncbi:MAG: ABC transporter ATP-binding protein [Pseudomonadota bacterium]